MVAPLVKPDPMVGEVTLTRVIDAPRALVFRMWTEAEHLKAWWGPRGFTNPVCEIDPRVGGAIHIVMRAPYGVDHAMGGEILEISPPDRLVFTNYPVGENGEKLIDGVATVTFADEPGGKTRLTVHTRAVGLAPIAAQMIAGMNQGWSESLDRLAEQSVGSRPERDGELIIRRTFDAPRALVFAAFSDPTHAVHWWGPSHHPAVHVEMGDKVGDPWRLCLKGVEDGRELWQGGVLTELIPPERIGFTMKWDADTGIGDGAEMHVSIALAEEDGGKTRMTFHQTRFTSTYERDGHRGGWGGSFDRLDAYLAGRP
jgi:uncharacterized protein YndB with AHSA1/START domain